MDTSNQDSLSDLLDLFLKHLRVPRVANLPSYFFDLGWPKDSRVSLFLSLKLGSPNVIPWTMFMGGMAAMLKKYVEEVVLLLPLNPGIPHTTNISPLLSLLPVRIQTTDDYFEFLREMREAAAAIISIGELPRVDIDRRPYVVPAVVEKKERALFVVVREMKFEGDPPKLTPQLIDTVFLTPEIFNKMMGPSNGNPLPVRFFQGEVSAYFYPSPTSVYWGI